MNLKQFLKLDDFISRTLMKFPRSIGDPLYDFYLWITQTAFCRAAHVSYGGRWVFSNGKYSILEAK